MRRWCAAIGLCLVLIGSMWALPVRAQSNLLVNPGFEEGFHVEGGAPEVSAANGWTAWWVQGSRQQTNEGYLVRPEYKGEDSQIFGSRRVHSGRYSQKYFNTYSTHDAGLYQALTVPNGATLQFSGWVQVWSSSGDNSGRTEGSGSYQVSLGIDPTGGIDPGGTAVVWSSPAYADNLWVQLSVTAQARGDRVTVFLRGAPQYRVKHNDSYWDDLSLVQAAASVLPPQPTPPPAPQPTPTSPPSAAAPPPADAPAADLTYTVVAGDTLFRIASRFGTTVQSLMASNGLQNPDFVWVGQHLLVRGTGEAAQSTTTSTYAVQPGDSLASIALRYNTTVAALTFLNAIVNPNLLYVGQRLILPGSGSESGSQPVVHVVQRGETLMSIAARYGVSMWSVAQANSIANVNVIQAGQALVIPVS